jgi:hypothetical protein
MRDFKSEPEELQRQELAAVERVFRSGQFILGNEYNSSGRLGQDFVARNFV